MDSAREYFCEVCQKEGIKLTLGVCFRDHPESVKGIVRDNENGDWYVSTTGKTTEFSKIDAKKLDEKIVFSAKVISTSDILNYDIVRTYVCPECEATLDVKCDDFREITHIKIMCVSCQKANMIIDQHRTIVGNIRKVILQETMEEMNINPRRIEAEVIADFVYDMTAGKDYKFEAVVWSKPIKSGSNLNRFVLNVTRVRCIDEDTAVLPNQLEIEKFKSIDANTVANSLAPHIKYRTQEKKAVLLSMLSGGTVDDIRGDFNVLMVGDPSTGKSQILNASVGLDNKSQKVSGRSTSSAGLVMGVDNLPDGTRMATFGPAVLCHKHHVAIDEMDKMRADDRSALHDVMEDQKAYLNKVGINLTVNAATKIIGACNPKASRYDKDGTIKANIGMPDSFLARFGYIFLLLDDMPREQERECIRHINRIKQIGLDEVIKADGLLTKDELTKYVNYAKTFNPVMTTEATIKLEDLYIHLKYMKQEADSLQIDKRTYHDIIRAAYSFAKFRFSDKVELEDVNNAWELKLYALGTFGMSTQGEFNQSSLAPSERDSRMIYITKVCKESMDSDGHISEDSLLVNLQGDKKKVNSLEDAKQVVVMLKNMGNLLNTGNAGELKYNE
jgi:DNA replicative helicase MCM subunit Mcm2 (Cdc46/Mcm family)